MPKSRIELRHDIRLLDASISTLRLKYPMKAEFVSYAEGAFDTIMSNAAQEDKEWVFDAVDVVCTRHGLPYPAF